jgi:hypothetical protein
LMLVSSYGDLAQRALNQAQADVDRFRGRISVESAPGPGSQFRLVLPAVSKSGLAVARPAPSVTHVGKSVPLRVLAVDDEPAMTRALVRMLRPAGH